MVMTKGIQPIKKAAHYHFRLIQKKGSKSLQAGQRTTRPKSRAVSGHAETTASQEQTPEQQSTASKNVMDKTTKFLADWNEIDKVGRNAAPGVKEAFPSTKSPLRRRGKEVWEAIKKSFENETGPLCTATVELTKADVEKIDGLIKAATAFAEKGRKAEPVEEASKSFGKRALPAKQLT